jgi:hypothetical protein
MSDESASQPPPETPASDGEEMDSAPGELESSPTSGAAPTVELPSLPEPLTGDDGAREEIPSLPVRVQPVNSSGGSASENPLIRAFDVSLLVPESVEVRMVDASALANYEVWVFIASVLSNAVLGFLVAFFQSDESWSLLASALVFFVLFVVSASWAFVQRRQLRKRSRRVKLQAIEAITRAD